MPTEPVVERIALELVERLETISPDAGYNYAPARVLRPKREGYSPEHLLIVLDQGDPTIQQEVEGNPFRYEWVQPFHLGLFVKPTDDDTEPIAAVVNKFRSDVEKAICTPANWENFDGLAIDAHWSSPARFTTDDGSYDGILLQLDITYRVAPGDPATVA